MASLKDLPNVTLLALDVTNKCQIQAAVETVSSQISGKLLCLVNNAARNHFMPLLDDDIDSAKAIFETNVWGPLAVTQAFAPLLIEAQGTLVNITSIAGHGAVPTMGTYGASKIAQEQIADVFRLELMPFKVKGLMVVTGAIPTNGQTYFGDWKLPANSRYKSAEEKMKTVVQASDGMPRTPREEYANQVVDHILGGTTGKVWLGERAEMVKNSPVEGEGALIRDQMVMKGFALDEISG